MLQIEDLKPLFTLLTVTYRKKPCLAVCTSYEKTEPDATPYRVTFEDGVVDDMTKEEFDKAQQAHQQLSHLHVIHRSIRRPLRILDLCSGTKSVGKAIRALFPTATIVTVDIESKYNPTHEVDIVNWEPLKSCEYKGKTIPPYKPYHFDFIWCSPPCTEYSYSKTIGQRDLVNADCRVKAALRIIQQLQPKVWVIENPVGFLEKRTFMQEHANLKHTTTYCCYGFPYRKATNIWTNAPVLLKNCKDTPCAYKLTHNRHAQTAQHGPSKHSDGTITPGSGAQNTLYAVPAKLVQQIVLSAFTCFPAFKNKRSRER